MKNIIKIELDEHIKIAKLLYSLTDDIAAAAQICIDSINRGGKILLLGNGGSAADAQHIAAELVGRYKANRKSLPAIALTTDSSVLTSISNDFGYDNVKEYLNFETDTLVKKENYDRYSFDGVAAWWKNKASKRYESLKADGRLRRDLETWNNNAEIDIIR